MTRSSARFSSSPVVMSEMSIAFLHDDLVLRDALPDFLGAPTEDITGGKGRGRDGLVVVGNPKSAEIPRACGRAACRRSRLPPSQQLKVNVGYVAHGHAGLT